MPLAILLIGAPGAGKTTSRKSFPFILPENIISSDDIIESYAYKFGVTYSDAFPLVIKTADEEAIQKFYTSVRGKKDLLIDRTNMSMKSRKKWLTHLDGYTKVAYYYPITQEELKRRNAARAESGKVIPKAVLTSMLGSFEYPTVEEGFDAVFEYIEGKA